jgi:hypothetical protein
VQLRYAGRFALALRSAKVAALGARRFARWAIDPEFAGLSRTTPRGPIAMAVRMPMARRDADPRLEAGKRHNVRLAIAALHGLVITPAQPFSFWRAVGPATAARGYSWGMELRSGCAVPAIGGGICLVTNALFTIENNKLKFHSYYKLPAPQTAQENCVAHNGSLIPIPGRDVMVQAWYQGGISVFDWTDPKKPTEIAYFDRGPVDSTKFTMGGSWSVYWYNGQIVSSEIARGLDVMELTPSQYVSQNEIDAAKTVRLDYLNAQGQPKFTWPPSFALARAYLDQLERSKCLAGDRIAAARNTLSTAERAAPAARRESLTGLAGQLDSAASGSCDAPKIGKLSQTARELAALQP